MRKTTTAAAALLASIAAVEPAHATFDFDFRCSDGSEMSYVGPYNEMTVSLPSGAAIRMPSAVPNSYVNVFSLFLSPGDACEVGSRLVPCASMLDEDGSPSTRAFHVLRDRRVECESKQDDAQ